jgi:phospholipid N-methyltransferase
MSWNRLGGFTTIPHSLALGIVAACLEIQVRIVHSCVSAIKMNAKLLLLDYGPFSHFRSDQDYPIVSICMYTVPVQN